VSPCHVLTFALSSPSPPPQMELNLLPSARSGLHTSVLKLWDRNVVLARPYTSLLSSST